MPAYVALASELAKEICKRMPRPDYVTKRLQPSTQVIQPTMVKVVAEAKEPHKHQVSRVQEAAD